ncbi:S41 family peptidase [Sphingobacterium hungaricum]
MMLKKILILCLFLQFPVTIFSQIPNTLSLDEKIYGLSKFWSEANYNFVYLYKVNQAQWDAAYKEAITNIQSTKNDYDYFRELQKLCALLKDGHTLIHMPENLQNLVMTTHFGAYRLFLTNIDGKVYVMDVNKSKELEIPVGSEIVKVNGLATADYQARFVKPYLSTSTIDALDNQAAYSLLAGLEGDQYEIELLTPKGERKSFTLTHATTEETALSSVPLPPSQNFEFKWVQKDIAYVAIRTFEDATVVKEFEAKLPELQKAKKIILDVRNNGGGSSRNSLNIAKYFIEQDTIYGARNYSREIIPTDRAIGSFLTAADTVNGKEQWGLSKEDATAFYKAAQGAKFHKFAQNPIPIQSDSKLSVPTAILTNNYTASAAEDFLIYLLNSKNSTQIGEYTNGSTGQPLQVELPGDASAWICTKKVTLPNGEEFVGIGINPDIVVKRNLNDALYPSKFDSQLTEAIHFLENKK